MASSIGSHYRCSVFGESHGEMIGVEIDGMPPGEAIDEAELARFMARRAPGSSKLTTQRKEADTVHLATGVMNGVTTGFPFLAYILNTNQRSKDYSNLLDHPRPSHADYTAYVHYKGLRRYARRRSFFRQAHSAAVHRWRHCQTDPAPPWHLYWRPASAGRRCTWHRL